MRNQFSVTVAIYSLAIFLTATIGCKQNNPPPAAANQATQLSAGYKSLEQKDYDDAIEKANAFLTATPAGAGSAEAFYLKGRAMEQRPAASAAESQENLRYAASLYQQGLALKPTGRTEAYLRASLANVEFFQDDYSSALSQWSSAYEKINEPDVQSIILYRVGVCQQRLGRFSDADRTFAAVQQRYPNTSAAKAAKSHEGARAFWVQLATFKSASGADKASGDLEKQGVTVQRSTDSQGRFVLRAGPFTSYDQAKAMKGKASSSYSDALIVP